MKDELKQYQKEPDVYLANISLFGGGYDVMEVLRKKGWRPISSWGKDGYDLGSWPYVIIFFRRNVGQYELLYYVEGDVTLYVCPSEELRQQIADELAFFHWKHQEEDWVKDYESVDQLPNDLRGPYRD